MEDGARLGEAARHPQRSQVLSAGRTREIRFVFLFTFVGYWARSSAWPWGRVQADASTGSAGVVFLFSPGSYQQTRRHSGGTGSRKRTAREPVPVPLMSHPPSVPIGAGKSSYCHMPGKWEVASACIYICILRLAVTRHC